jgi:hypothetical protein
MLARLLPIICVPLFIGVMAQLFSGRLCQSHRFLTHPTHKRGAAAVTIAWAVFACSDSQSAHYAFAGYIYRANVGLHSFYDFNISRHVLHLQA